MAAGAWKWKEQNNLLTSSRDTLAFSNLRPRFSLKMEIRRAWDLFISQLFINFLTFLFITVPELNLIYSASVALKTGKARRNVNFELPSFCWRVLFFPPPRFRSTTSCLFTELLNAPCEAISSNYHTEIAVPIRVNPCNSDKVIVPLEGSVRNSGHVKILSKTPPLSRSIYKHVRRNSSSRCIYINEVGRPAARKTGKNWLSFPSAAHVIQRIYWYHWFGELE